MFSSYPNSQMFKDLPIFLWLGNVRRFKEMVRVERGGVDRYFGEDCRVGNDGEKALTWIVEKYLSGVKTRKNVVVSLLDELDVENVNKAVGEMGNVLLGLTEKKEKRRKS